MDKKGFLYPPGKLSEKFEGICNSFCINLKNLRLWAIVPWFGMVFCYIYSGDLTWLIANRR